MQKLASLSLIIPCFNEAEVLPITVPKIKTVLQALIDRKLISSESTILFVDDGSKDATWEMVSTYNQQYPSIKGLKLSRNFGHQNALLAGLMHAETDITVSIDADLQDDLNVIEQMIIAYYEGYDIIYGVRKSRNEDTFFKRFFAQNYYRFLHLLGVDIVQDHADFRLMSAKALKSLENFKEANLFLRGIIPILGFKSKQVEYARTSRVAGETKYNTRKMLALAINGVTSFSVVPLLLIMWLGIIISVISASMGLWALITKFIIGGVVKGWTSIVVPMYFLGGVQLLTLGIIGIYLSKVYTEVKERPRFILEDEIK